jgi:hypothetical protein
MLLNTFGDRRSLVHRALSPHVKRIKSIEWRELYFYMLGFSTKTLGQKEKTLILRVDDDDVGNVKAGNIFNSPFSIYTTAATFIYTHLLI